MTVSTELQAALDRGAMRRLVLAKRLAALKKQEREP